MSTNDIRFSMEEAKYAKEFEQMEFDRLQEQKKEHEAQRLQRLKEYAEQRHAQEQAKKIETYGKNPNIDEVRVIDGVPYRIQTNHFSEITEVQPLGDFDSLSYSEQNAIFHASRVIYNKLNMGQKVEPNYDLMASHIGKRLDVLEERTVLINMLKSKGHTSHIKEVDSLGVEGFKAKYPILF